MFNKLLQRYRIGITVMLLLLISGFIAGVFCFQHWQLARSRQALYSTLLTTARPIPEFEIKGTDNHPFGNAQLKGQWTWLFFGFTQCPQLCPTTMNKLAKAYQELQAQHVEELPHVVMITLDPERDNLAKLKTYVQAFEPNFYGANGQKEVVKNLAAQLGIAYAKIQAQSNSKNDYTIEHSGAVMVVNPEGQLQAFFNPPFNVKQLVHDHQIFIRK